MKDFSENVIGSSSFERDVTEQKKMHAEMQKLNDELKESNDRFSKIFQNNPVAMALSVFETRKLENVNAKFLELFGFTKEEVIGKTAVGQLLKNDTITGNESLATKKNGEQIWTLGSAQVIYIQGVKFIATSFQDISYRKRKEQDLKDKTQDLEREKAGLEDRNKVLNDKNKENENTHH